MKERRRFVVVIIVIEREEKESSQGQNFGGFYNYGGVAVSGESIIILDNFYDYYELSEHMVELFLCSLRFFIIQTSLIQ